MGKRKQSATIDLKVRMKEPLRAALEQASRKRGISMNAEAVSRLERSFQTQNTLNDMLSFAYGDEVGGLILAIAALMTKVGPFAAHQKAMALGERNQPWTDDPYSYDQAVLAAIALLRRARPNPISYSHDRKKDKGHRDLIVNELIRTLKGISKATWAEGIFGKQNVDTMRSLLGPIVDRLRHDDENVMIVHGREG